jgi:hypothetical protein
MATAPAGAPPAAPPTGAPPAAPAAPAPPLDSNGQPVQGATWDPTRGVWIASNGGILQTDPKTNRITANIDPTTGKPNLGTVTHASIPVFGGGSPLKAATNALGITNPAPPNISQGPDVQAQRDLATQLRADHARAGTAVAPVLDQTAANQDRGTAENNIRDLQGVAAGTTQTAADALLTKGTDAAAKNAAGLAAAYSRGNPGMALREGLAAGANDYATAASTAAMQKAKEQETARSDIGNYANSLRAGDIGAAGADQSAAVTTAGQNITDKLGTGNTAVTATSAPTEADYASQRAQLENQKNNQQGTGSLLTAFGALSDERAKKNITPVSLADALGREVHGVEFQYKPGQADGGKHAGVLAQDVERALPGAVKEGPDGMKRVDTGHAALATMGAVSELARRLRVVEGKKGDGSDDDEGVSWGPNPWAREPASKPITMRGSSR